MPDIAEAHPTEEAEADGPIGRQGWEEQFRRMAEQGDDKVLDGSDLILTQWEEKEWEEKEWEW